MFYDERFSSGLGRYYAMSLRFGVNYSPDEDKADLIALLRSPNADDRNNAIFIFIRDIHLGVEGLPLELIPHVFANIQQDWTRHTFCKILIENGIFPDELKDECLYDYNKQTRELFLKT